MLENVRKTLKSPDTEGWFEIIFTRTPGYYLAQAFRLMRWHPIAVTLLSIVLGVAAGYYLAASTPQQVCVGIALLLIANWLDCADGQLARMTGKTTLIGRILDGFAGDLWFFFIYFFICWNAKTWWIWPLAAVAGFFCHARQCALADYYRNIHMYFSSGGTRGELDRSEDVISRMKAVPAASPMQLFEKIYLFFYSRYTLRQENMTPAFQEFYAHYRRANLSAAQREDICRRVHDGSLPLMLYARLLTFDLRVGVLFLSVLVGAGWIYFVFELTVMEILRLVAQRRHEAMCRSLTEHLRSLTVSA